MAAMRPECCQQTGLGSRNSTRISNPLNEAPSQPSSPAIYPEEMKHQITQLQGDLQLCCSSQLEEKFRLMEDRLIRPQILRNSLKFAVNAINGSR